MDQFDERHYKFMREYRGSCGEHMPMRKSASMRPQEPDASIGDKWVFVGAVVVAILFIIFA